MNLLTVWLISNDESREDDKIEFDRSTSAHSNIDVTYTPATTSTSVHTYSFTVTREGARRYLGNLFQSLQMDLDPWDKVQITPATGPAIMYHVSDLDSAEDVIMSTVDELLYTDVYRE
jgi:hypothetical protein